VPLLLEPLLVPGVVPEVEPELVPEAPELEPVRLPEPYLDPEVDGVVLLLEPAPPMPLCDVPDVPLFRLPELDPCVEDELEEPGVLPDWEPMLPEADEPIALEPDWPCCATIWVSA